ncbi:MAG: hemerythrin domain-containing protein [Rhodocyclales bacterium]|nr:hemerythrin domain-containing protein [Rhodocyclales bacterium]
MRPAMRVLAKEHLALRAVARIVAIEAEVLRRDGRVDLDLLEDIAAYIAEFPNRIHHPKEEDFLFRHMRIRAPQRCGEILDRLLAEHVEESESIGTFRTALAAYRNGLPAADTHLANVAASYAKYLDRHIEFENTQAFPLATEVLQESDWAEIDAAFLANDDPLVTGDQDSRYTELHRRILRMGALPPGL